MQSSPSASRAALLGLVYAGLLAAASGCPERSSRPRATGPRRPARKPGDVARLQSTHADILIFDEGPYRCLAFGSRAGVQSCVHRRRRLDYRYEYVRMFFAVTAMVDAPRRVLVLGLGGAALPTLLGKFFPKARIDVVEIDGGVYRMAKKYMYYEPTARTHVSIEDAARFVARAAKPGGARYDLVFVDCYDGVHIPKHLLADAFVTDLHGILAPRGLVASNFWSTHPSYPTSLKQFCRIFGDVWRIPGRRSTNHIVIAAAARLALTPAAVRVRGAALDKRFALPFRMSEELARIKRLTQPQPTPPRKTP